MIPRVVLVAFVASLTLLGVAPRPALDSQLVLARYEMALDDLVSPSVMIFTYTISQAGPTDIEQRHRLYRSGLNVRDELLSDDGVGLKQKIVRIAQREDRYTVGRLAPRATTYALLFLHTIGKPSHLSYVYQATPLAPASSSFTVTRVTIDGTTFLPSAIKFHSVGANAHGTGEIMYGTIEHRWVPLSVTIDASVDGHSARERITWSSYRFPASLPDSTFIPARPLPHQTLPSI